MIKEENEITLKVVCSFSKICHLLEEKGFKKIKEAELTDYFYIPHWVNIKTMSNREILHHAILIRHLVSFTDKSNSILITYKQKEFDEHGNIVFQKSTNCHVLNLKEAQELLQILGYKDLMQIQEFETTYEKDGLEIELKNIKDGLLLLEVETLHTNPNLDTIEKVKNLFNSYDLPVDKSNYYLKKAELKLDELKRT